MRLGVAPCIKVFPQQSGLDWAVVGALVPIPEVAEAEPIGAARVCEQRDDAVLSSPFGSGLGEWRIESGELRIHGLFTCRAFGSFDNGHEEFEYLLDLGVD